MTSLSPFICLLTCLNAMKNWCYLRIHLEFYTLLSYVTCFHEYLLWLNSRYWELIVTLLVEKGGSGEEPRQHVFSIVFRNVFLVLVISNEQKITRIVAFSAYRAKSSSSLTCAIYGFEPITSAWDPFKPFKRLNYHGFF